LAAINAYVSSIGNTLSALAGGKPKIRFEYYAGITSFPADDTGGALITTEIGVKG